MARGPKLNAISETHAHGGSACPRTPPNGIAERTSERAIQHVRANRVEGLMINAIMVQGIIITNSDYSLAVLGCGKR